MASDIPPPSTLRTRPTLLFRLRDWNDEASWTEFYRLYYQFVYGCARRTGLSHADAEEVTQDVFKRVAETVHEFEADPARGSFRGWLTNLTRWRITDKLRARRPHERYAARSSDDDRTDPVERLPDVLQAIAHVLPLTYAVEGLREVMLKGADLSSSVVQTDIAVLAGVALFFVLIASLTIKREVA